MSETRTFQTLTTGLDHRLPPMRLWRKSKRFGVWDPAAIDFTRDIEDWRGLSDLEREVLLHLKNDESRHLAYGVFLLSRLVAEHGDDVWSAVETRMGELLPHAIESVNELFGCYDELPFGLDQGVFVNFAMGQFQKRFARIERARNQTLEQVLEIDTGADDEAAA